MVSTAFELGRLVVSAGVAKRVLDGRRQSSCAPADAQLMSGFAEEEQKIMGLVNGQGGGS